MLKYLYDAKSDIPQGLEKFYTEKDGKFVLQVDGVKTEDDVKSVKDVADKERKLRREAEAKVKELNDKYGLLPENFDIDEFNRLKDSDPGKELEAKLTEQRERITKQFETKLAEKDKIIEEKDGLVTTHVKDATLQKAMVEANIAAPYVSAVSAMMKDRITVEGGKVFLDEQPVGEALKAWSQTDEGKHYVSASSNSGGGSENSNPNVSHTGKTIKRSDFDKLDQSARAAKVKEKVKVVDG